MPNTIQLLNQGHVGLTWEELATRIHIFTPGFRKKKYTDHVTSSRLDKQDTKTRHHPHPQSNKCRYLCLAANDQMCPNRNQNGGNIHRVPGLGRDNEAWLR